MNMQMINRPSRIRKVISITLVYALLLDLTMPSVYALDALFTPNYAWNTMLSHYKNSVEAGENNSLQDKPLVSVVKHTEVEEFTGSFSTSMASSGAHQAESSGFSIGSTDGMVDKFTGDFSYSIPLLNAEGYPIVLAYNSNVTMLNEASWVGLGWDLNVGSISRDMRGIPDDFNGNDIVMREFNQKGNDVKGVKNGGYLNLGLGGNGFGAGVGISLLGGRYTDTYLGKGKTWDLNIGGSARYSIESGEEGALFLSPTINLGMSYDSKNGIGSTFGLGLKAGWGNESGTKSNSLTYQRSKNSRYGLTDYSISVGYSNQKSMVTDRDENQQMALASSSISSTSGFTYGTTTSMPRVNFTGNTNSSNFEFDLYFGLNLKAVSLRVGYLRQNYNSTSTILYHSGQTIYQPAYGFMHSGKRKGYSGNYFPIMDYNRAVENEYSEEMKTLPFSVQTHDVFYVNASGINGTFRPQRTDYGTYYDANSENMFNNESQLMIDDDVTTLATGVTIGLPLTIGFGLAYSSGTMKAEQKSGNWTSGMNLLEFTQESPSNSFDKSVYFRPMGSVTPVDMTSWNLLNGNNADYFDINANGQMVQQESYLKRLGTNVSPGDLNTNSQQTFSEFYFKPNTVAELTASGQPYYKTHFKSIAENGSGTVINRNQGARKNNHISSVDVVSPDGVRYEYGIPVYTFSTQEVSFSTGPTVNISPANESVDVTGSPIPELSENAVPTGIVTYNTSGTDGTVSTTRGRSHYFDRTLTPGYAGAFLLTQMVSSDYIDRTNDGPTIDDIGNYYKFNYTRIYGDADPYGVRFPISGINPGSSKAMLTKGTLGSNWDDVANYTYSETEVWYTHSLETKNLIVEFHLEKREDAYSANEYGILESGKQKRYLSEIVVYNRNDKMANGANALPLQTIRFYYDYSLCQKAPGNPNTYNGSGNESGKLTLKEIRTFNGNSYENALSSIRFEYASGAANPDFSYSNMDGWGLNKPNTVLKPNDLYPYVNQEESAANLSAQAWKLVAIYNAAGGRIEIDYESDSYGYVQDERAMRNFDVYRMTDIFDFLKIRSTGSWNGVNRSSGAPMEQKFHHAYGNNVSNFVSELGLNPGILTNAVLMAAIFGKSALSPYNQKFGQFDPNLVPNNVIVFRLDKPLSSSEMSQNDADAKVADLYFRDPNNPSKGYITDLYTKMYVKIKEGVYDLVPAMSKVSQDYNYSAFGGSLLGQLPETFKAFGAMPPNPGTNQYEYGYVIVDPAHTGKRGNKKADEVKKGSIAMHPMQLMALEYARTALPDKVYGADPESDGDMSIDRKVFFGDDIYKYMISDGGYCGLFEGNRSLIRLNEPDYTKYGGGARVRQIRYYDNWEYISGEYDSQYSWSYTYTTAVGRDSYSTGVASFEPMSILDESPLNEWITYTNIRKKFPDENKFVPGPLAYQLFPKPVVGYEKVEVQFVEAGNYGKSTTKYYTAKDFPTITRSTTIDKSAKVSKNNIVTGMTKDLYGVTQGYVVETNNFHGKLRMAEVSKKDQQNNDITISKTVYNYYGKGEKVKLADRSGEVGLYNVALEYDMHADSKYCTDQNDFLQMGLDFVLNWTPPILFTPSFKPIFAISSRERSFYSHTLIKHINYSAVVRDVVTEYLGSVNTATTNVFDMYTGAPVVSELTDEYNDHLYQVNYPSHWRHKELRELHEINGKTMTISLGTDGAFLTSSTNANNALSPGDIVFVDGQNLQVAQALPRPENGLLFLIQSDGTKYFPTAGGNKTVTIVQSNRDNRLLEGMQSFTTKVNPISGSSITCPKDDILSASAITYRDRLSALCGESSCHEGANNNVIPMGAAYNPYDYGLRGDLVLDKQFAWQSERANEEDPHGIRFDGAYRNANPSDPNFILFYEGDGTGNWAPIFSGYHSENLPVEKYRLWRPLGNVTDFDQFGNAVEAKDQINVHSAVLMGYSATYNALPTAQAVNAQKEQIAFDGFEDYQVNATQEELCRIPESHFDFYLDVLQGGNGVDISTTNRHSGLAALQVSPNKSATVTKGITASECSAADIVDERSDRYFEMDECACVSPFAPSPGKYLIGAWVSHQLLDMEAPIIEVVLDGGSPLVFSGQGPLIDGWQRVEGVFDIPPGTNTITVRLKNSKLVGSAYFDDLRIHPFLAGMQTTVYDPNTFLPMATHDGYNFTTYYNYDENLNLVRVRVETVDGIKTVMENEGGGQKSYPSN